MKSRKKEPVAQNAEILTPRPTPNLNRLQSLLEEYAARIRNNMLSPNIEAHFREALFEESVTAYFGDDAWMQINAH